MMATIHEINKEWQREGVLPTWVKLQKAQDEFDALQKQMESQKDEWLSWQAKRKELEKDAARYRWLKERAAVSHVLQATPTGFHYPTTLHIVTGGSDTDIDAAIDTAMKGE